VAIAQIDIKRAFSHSTSAYLGLVFIAVGMRAPDVALAFLFTHAIARALLFMSTGAIMLFTFTQDLTAMGGLGKKMPATALAGYRARIRNHGHSCFLCEIVIRSQFHTTYEPEA
jgi:NADH:ubiquinone oxidoreductase subunit 5 (chain L)/Multisubunit Na+/H+ antiporter, MnhA subunit